MEAKDVRAAFSPRTISNRANLYQGRDQFVDKLLRKAEALRGNPAAVAVHIGVPAEVAARTTWQVLPLLVTSEVEPAAFVAEPRVPFVVEHDLAAVLNNAHDPPPGHAPIGRRQ